jgi:glycosyltransferase involved in cell wall biosynthesis
VRIVIDARMLYWTGVSRYTKALLSNLEEIDHENEYLVLVRQKDWHRWEPKGPNFQKIRADIDPYTFDEQLTLPRLLRSLKPDLVHFTTPNTPLLWRGRRVVTVHDLTLLDFSTSRDKGLKRWLNELKRLPFRLVMLNDAKTATVVTTGTNYVKNQLIKRYHSRPERVLLAPLAVDVNLAKPVLIDTKRVGENYILYVGNFYPYKNIASTIEAIRIVLESKPDLKLVLVGQDDFFRQGLVRMVKTLGIEKSIVFTGFVTDGELVSYYLGAKAFVYPSLSEGFGLQGFEAMSLGIPVLAAKASCFPEVYGEAAGYFDPMDPNDQAKKILDLLGNKDEQTRLKKAGSERIKLYSWRDTALKTHKAYQIASKQLRTT